MQAENSTFFPQQFFDKLHFLFFYFFLSKYKRGAEIPDYDIALLELIEDVKFSPFISPACLPDGDVRFYPGKQIQRSKNFQIKHFFAVPSLIDQR